MKKLYLFLGSIFLFAGMFDVQSILAQPTGIVTSTYTATDGSTRTEVLIVRKNYDKTKKYRLIVALHGLSGDPTNYSSYFIGMMGGNSPLHNDSSNNGCNSYLYWCNKNIGDYTIIACPQGNSSAQGDFLTGAADTAAITHIMANVIKTYNIDPNYIYLNGESLGGRAALWYALVNNNWKRFRGLLLWVAAINNPLPDGKYSYQNASMIPITTQIASGDGMLYADIEAYRKIYQNRGIVLLENMIPFCHNAPTDNYTFDALDFIDRNATTHQLNDAGIYAVLSPATTVCSGSITPTIQIQNKGVGSLTSATINYQMDGGAVSTLAWTGNLNQLQRNDVTLPTQTVTPGAHTLKVFTTNPNGSTDNFPTNDAVSVNFNYVVTGAKSGVSVAANFDNQPAHISGIYISDWRHTPGWSQSGTDSTFYWELDTNGGSFSSAACIHFNNYAIDAGTSPGAIGKKYNMLTPVYDFSSANSPQLTFDYAYATMKSGGTTITGDSLKVLYTTDCGANWNTLWAKGGTALQTFTNSSGGDKATGQFALPTSSNFLSATVPLSSLAGLQNVQFAFQNVVGGGSLIHLDNISFSGVLGTADLLSQSASLNVYPNPTDGIFTIDLNTTEKSDYILQVRNVLGQEVYTENLNQFSGNLTKQLNMKANGNGLYFISLKTEKGELFKKIVVY